MSQSQSEKARHATLEKKRKEMLESFAAQKNELLAESHRNRTGSDRFTAKTSGVEEALKQSTYGLVQLSDFKETREKLEEQARKDAAGAGELKDEERKKKKRKKEGKVKLSFAMDDEEEEGDSSFTTRAPMASANVPRGDIIPSSISKSNGEHQNSSPTTTATSIPAENTDPNHSADLPPPPLTIKKVSKLGKNPNIDTSFLPDREREEAERKVRDELRREWLQVQEDMKKEDIEITCSFWDGTGHRAVVNCKKGDTIAQFLSKCRDQFSEIRSTSVDNLMYIKEDLIIPHHYTFYDFIVNKYRGKSGPMFNFDVHDDVRLTADATVEKDESHAGKIVERSWYNRSKHIFPASRWEVFNPAVIRDRYTIHGD